MPNVQFFLALLLAIAMTFCPIVPRVFAAPPPERGQGDIHRDDPCTHLPNPPGNANGIDKQCPAAGSSSGIAKGDFNGDGYADLAIGEPGATINGHSSAGDVIILYGGPSGLTTTGREDWYLSRIPACPLAPICMGVDYAGVNPQSDTGDLFGSALASGDFNGDGFSDLAIGTPGKTVVQNPLGLFPITHQQSGAVVILFGSKNGLTVTDPTVPAPTLWDLNAAPNSYFGNWGWDGAHFGGSLAWGNFNGDKNPNTGSPIGDLAIGVLGADQQILGVTVVANAGVVLVFPGADAARGILLDPLGSFRHFSKDFLGASLTSGDFNGDGFSDLAIGAPGWPAAGDTTQPNAGAVEVVFGSPGGLNPSNTPGVEFWTQSNVGATPFAGDRFGAALAAGDFNGDGKTDLAIGAPGRTVLSAAGAGGVFVVAGGPAGLSLGIQAWNQNTLGHGVQAGAGFGTVLAAGDFNADGRADLAIGVPFRTVGTLANAGEVDVIYGSANGLSTSAVRSPQFWTQDNALGAGSSQAGARFGDSLTAWNFGRNESFFNGFFLVPKLAADLAIGAPLQSVSGVSGAGAVNVLYGSFASNGLVNTSPNIWNANTTNIGAPLSGAHFGAAVY